MTDATAPGRAAFVGAVRRSFEAVLVLGIDFLVEVIDLEGFSSDSILIPQSADGIEGKSDGNTQAWDDLR